MFEHKIYNNYFFFFLMRKKLAPIYIFSVKNIIVYKYTMFDIMCMTYVNKTKYCHMMFIKKTNNNNNNVKNVLECILYHLKKAHI